MRAARQRSGWRSSTTDQVFADALAGRLREEHDLTVVGTARAASDSWELLQRNDVDVIALRPRPRR